MEFQSRTSPAPPRLRRAVTRDAAFKLLEVVVAAAIMAVGFLGMSATVLSAGKMVSASEEEALFASGQFRASYFEPDGAVRFRPEIRRVSLRDRTRCRCAGTSVAAVKTRVPGARGRAYSAG